MAALPEPVPTSVRRRGVDGVQITWSDGHDSLFPNRYLRDNCPCAYCHETRPQFALPVLDGEPPHPVHIHVVGRYALGMVWSDGHETGIYSYRTLRTLCPCDVCAPPVPN